MLMWTNKDVCVWRDSLSSLHCRRARSPLFPSPSDSFILPPSGSILPSLSPWWCPPTHCPFCCQHNLSSWMLYLAGTRAIMWTTAAFCTNCHIHSAPLLCCSVCCSGPTAASTSDATCCTWRSDDYSNTQKGWVFIKHSSRVCVCVLMALGFPV